MKESDLFEPLKQYLLNKMSCEEVYAEVMDIDVVAKHGNCFIGIEMKTSLNFKVIEQAERRKHLVDYMFILVPRPKNRHSQLVLNWLQELGVGLMYYGKISSWESDGVSIKHWGKRDRTPMKHYIVNAIKREEPLMKVNIGGVKGGESITPYKNTIDKIKHCLYYSEEGLTIKGILENVQTHYAAPKPSVTSTLQAHWNREWCEIYVKDGERYFKMKDEYRESYWNEYMGLPREIRRLRRS